MTLATLARIVQALCDRQARYGDLKGCTFAAIYLENPNRPAEVTLYWSKR